MNIDSLEQAKGTVLTVTNAQEVYKHLRKLFQEERRFRSRWIWELLQNARDVSPEGGVKIQLENASGKLFFRHNGVPFTNESIAHLIYHGSTKYDQSSQSAIGQFGTGFLMTHLISKTVTVRGRMQGGDYFIFILDRRGENPSDLKSAMDHSWEDFKSSLAYRNQVSADGFETEYEYDLAGDAVGGVISDGIDELIRNAAYLMAFNRKIGCLDIRSQDRSMLIKRHTTQQIDDHTARIEIEIRKATESPKIRYVVVHLKEQTSVAIEIKKADKRWEVFEQSPIPRIFVAFPLLATREFCIPIVMNNETFQPREDRDTLVLISNSDGKHDNMVKMEEACRLARDLVGLVAHQNWAGAAMLMRLKPLGQWDWVEPDWFRKLVVEEYIHPLRNENILKTASGARIAPSAATIPWAIQPDLCIALWDIASRRRNALEQLPQREEATVWAGNLASWASFLSEDTASLGEVLTIDKLCRQVSEWGTTKAVESHLDGSVDPVQWINQLHELIAQAKDGKGLLEKYRLIPNQKNVLKKLTELKRDPGIDETLKDIAEELGLAPRDDLLQKGVLLDQYPELQKKTQDEVLALVIDNIQAKSKAAGDSFIGISAKLFVWLIHNSKTDKLKGFPVANRSQDSGVLLLDPARSDDKPLAPLGCWPEQTLRVADIVPKDQTLHDQYFNALPQRVLWEQLESEGYVRLGPVYRTQYSHIPFIPDEPLPEADKGKKHRTEGAVEVSALAFFDKPDAWLDAVRKSKKRAVELLLFLANYVLQKDPGALETLEAVCECGETHRYYPSAWIGPMCKNGWVPLGERKQGPATAETIAKLFDGQQEDLLQLMSGPGKILLNALGINLADLSLRAVAKGEDAQYSFIDSSRKLLHAAGGNMEELKIFAEEICASPDLLDTIRDSHEKREKIRQNQSFGVAVEQLLRGVLESRGLKVTRTGVGSDYEVEHDYIVNGQETIITVEDGYRSWLIEVKATVCDSVRLTKTQAGTAAGEKDRFILCVIQLESRDCTSDIVSDRCRFIADIGLQIEPLWESYQNYVRGKEELRTRQEAVELIVKDGEVKFAVGEKAWSDGLSLNQMVQVIMGTGNH